jgi:acetate kinase
LANAAPLAAPPERAGDPLAADHPASGDAEALLDWLAAALPPQLAGDGAGLALVGHRLVHGGERFLEPTRITAEVRLELEQLNPLAPLHNPPALRLIDALRRRWPALQQWACFDTAFHASLPPAARTYAIPASWRRQGLRRYGFHGLNHEHVAAEVQRRYGSEAPLRLISCHLGGGCSLCAIRDGRSIATTMGFTPLEGLVMASRSGTVDPGLLLYQLRAGLDIAELERGLLREGGLLGLSGLSGDMAELRAAAMAPPRGHGHAGAGLAIAVFRQRLLESIGAMAACLEGVDVIALSGGIGEHDTALHQELAAALGWLGRHQLLVIPADEEGQIARHCWAALADAGRP